MFLFIFSKLIICHIILSIQQLQYQQQLLKDKFKRMLDKKQKKTIKYNKNLVIAHKDNTERKQYNQSLFQQQYLSPINSKSSKNKSKIKKQIKAGKYNKSKKKKNSKDQSTGAIIGNQNIEIRTLAKQSKNILKQISKSDDKTMRQTSKKIKKIKNQQINLSSKKTLNNFSQFKTKQKEIKTKIILPKHQQQYLFLGEQFYLINNYCPTKRLLNTYRDALTNNDNIERKYLTQDRQGQTKKKIQFKKNIFTAARQHIQNKHKNQKAIKIQRWWRKFKKTLNNLNLDHSNPESKQSLHNIFQQNQFLINDINNRSFITQKNVETINQRGKEDIASNIISFDSSDIIDIPKKIDLKNSISPEKMMNQYKIPQENDSNINQNEDIFLNFNKFTINQANQQFNQSQDSEQSSQRLQNSPIKQQQEIFNNYCIKNQSQLEQNTSNLILQVQEAAKIRHQLDFRLYLQKGHIKAPQNKHSIGINTSVLSVHNFLVKFFHFYIQNNKQQFLSFINMPFGYNILSRLQHLQGKNLPSQPLQDEQGIVYGLQSIIDDKKFENFYKNLMRFQLNMNNSFIKANNQLQIIHNKAIVDLFNQQLNKYRPYCQIGGIPYPWNHSYKALTFYFVSEQNILEVFEKVQLKILKQASVLCGIHIESNNHKKYQQPFQMDKFMINYQKGSHQIICQHNEAKQNKFITQQLKQQFFQYDSQLLTKIMLQISDLVFLNVLLENIMQIHKFFNQK